MSVPKVMYQLGGGLAVKDLAPDDPHRKMYLVAKNQLPAAFIKVWLRERVETDVAQIMSEVEAALTPCAASGLLVAPVAVEVNPDGSTILVYCNGGKDMLDVVNDLHDAGDAAALRKNMLHFLTSVLLALAELHAQGKLHKDVKLANVLSSGRGMTRLADAGLLSDLHAPRSGYSSEAPHIDFCRPAQDASGRLAYEVPGAVSALNTPAIDIRQAFVSAMVGYAGHDLPDELSHRHVWMFDTPEMSALSPAERLWRRDFGLMERWGRFDFRPFLGELFDGDEALLELFSSIICAQQQDDVPSIDTLLASPVLAPLAAAVRRQQAIMRPGFLADSWIAYQTWLEVRGHFSYLADTAKAKGVKFDVRKLSFGSKLKALHAAWCNRHPEAVTSEELFTFNEDPYSSRVHDAWPAAIAATAAAAAAAAGSSATLEWHAGLRESLATLLTYQQRLKELKELKQARQQRTKPLTPPQVPAPQPSTPEDPPQEQLQQPPHGLQHSSTTGPERQASGHTNTPASSAAAAADNTPAATPPDSEDPAPGSTSSSSTPAASRVVSSKAFAAAGSTAACPPAPAAAADNQAGARPEIPAAATAAAGGGGGGSAPFPSAVQNIPAATSSAAAGTTLFSIKECSTEAAGGNTTTTSAAAAAAAAAPAAGHQAPSAAAASAAAAAAGSSQSCVSPSIPQVPSKLKLLLLQLSRGVWLCQQHPPNALTYAAVEHHHHQQQQQQQQQQQGSSSARSGWFWQRQRQQQQRLLVVPPPMSATPSGWKQPPGTSSNSSSSGYSPSVSPQSQRSPTSRSGAASNTYSSSSRRGSKGLTPPRTPAAFVASPYWGVSTYGFNAGSTNNSSMRESWVPRSTPAYPPHPMLASGYCAAPQSGFGRGFGPAGHNSSSNRRPSRQGSAGGVKSRTHRSTAGGGHVHNTLSTGGQLRGSSSCSSNTWGGGVARGCNPAAGPSWTGGHPQQQHRQQWQRQQQQGRWQQGQKHWQYPAGGHCAGRRDGPPPAAAAPAAPRQHWSGAPQGASCKAIPAAAAGGRSAAAAAAAAGGGSMRSYADVVRLSARRAAA